MSISQEYAKYCSAEMGNLTLAEYRRKLESLNEKVIGLVVCDPTDRMSNIGRKIFGYLKDDISSAIAFSQVSKSFNIRSKNVWFTTNAAAIVLRYIQRDLGYKEYLQEGGWKDLVIIGAEIAGITVTVTAGIKAAIHQSRIPSDAPKKTNITITDDGDIIEEVCYDHPEAREANMWKSVASVVGGFTACGIVAQGFYSLLKKVSVTTFFLPIERDLLSAVETSAALKILSPGYHSWKLEKMQLALSSNPTNWQQHPELINMICPISGEFILFPVKDRCGHYFDFRSVRGYQLDPTTINPLECPVNQRKPNTGLADIKFDKARFDRIQVLL